MALSIDGSGELSVFIAESLNSEDFYVGRLDGFAANEVLKIQQVRSQYRIVLTLKLLKMAIRDASDQRFRIFHLSCHGDDDGIQLADGTNIDWLSFAELVRPFANTDRMLVMSCCSGGYVGLTKSLQKKNAIFGYVLGSTLRDGVGFTDSCLAWSILYNRLSESGFGRAELRGTLDKINAVIPGNFVYRRWDGAVYRHYPSFATR